MAKKRTWTEQQLIECVKESSSLRNLLSLLHLKEAGGNYKTIKEKIENLKLDISHWTGKGHLKGKTHNYNPPKTLEDILTKESSYNTYKLKLRLIKENMIENKCSECGITDWNNKPLSLHLDHINGVNNDHRIENLRLLCPNCHSQTPTYAGKNKKIFPPKQIPKCKSCNTTISSNKYNYCIQCFNKQKAIKWPSDEELIDMVNNTNITEVSKKLNVSRKSIRNKLKDLKGPQNAQSSAR